MLLEDRVTVIYGGGGAIGGAVARAFGREGATVHLAGRTRDKLDAVARDIVARGGVAHVQVVDALDPAAVERHARTVAGQSGRIDVIVNALGILHVQGKPLLELTLDEYEAPIAGYTRAQFVIAKAGAPYLIAAKRGVFLSFSTPGAVRAYNGVLGFGTACAAIEGFTRQLAAELGASGVRVVCLRPDAMPETLERGSHARQVFTEVAKRHGIALEEMMKTATDAASLLKRSPTLDEIARTAAFVASDGGGAMTGTTINVSCGSVVD